MKMVYRCEKRAGRILPALSLSPLFFRNSPFISQYRYFSIVQIKHVVSIVYWLLQSFQRKLKYCKLKRKVPYLFVLNVKILSYFRNIF